MTITQANYGKVKKAEKNTGNSRHIWYSYCSSFNFEIWSFMKQTWRWLHIQDWLCMSSFSTNSNLLSSYEANLPSMNIVVQEMWMYYLLFYSLLYLPYIKHFSYSTDRLIIFVVIYLFNDPHLYRNKGQEWLTSYSMYSVLSKRFCYTLQYPKPLHNVSS